MKDNTYDIPGMKFYLLFAQDSSFPLATRTVDPAEVFPFEYFDGFKVEEVQELISRSSFAICSACYYENVDGEKNVGIIDLANFSTECLKDRKYMQVDTLFEQTLKNNLPQVERTYACFMERYQGKEYQEIKQLLKINKK